MSVPCRLVFQLRTYRCIAVNRRFGPILSLIPGLGVKHAPTLLDRLKRVGSLIVVLKHSAGDRADTRHGHEPADPHITTRQPVNLTVKIADLHGPAAGRVWDEAGLGALTRG